MAQTMTAVVGEEIRAYYDKLATEYDEPLSHVVGRVLREYAEQHAEHPSDYTYKKVRWSKGSFILTVPKHIVGIMGWSDARFVRMHADRDGLMIRRVD
jgi:hypothetical protein